MRSVPSTSWLVALLAFAPLLAWIAPALFGGPVGATAVWNLGVVVCFAGWGGWVARRLAPRVDVDLGLRAAWGLAFTLAVGGPLALLGLARLPLLALWVIGGMGLAAADAARALGREGVAARARRRLRRWETPVLLGLLVAGGILYVGASGFANPNPSDDWVAYLPHIKMLQQTGTVIDPFSVRRMASYGGQTYLQAIVRIVASESQIQSFDQGIGLLIGGALILGAVERARAGARLVGLLLIAVLLMFPEIRINSASEVSGLVGFLALYRSIVLVDANALPGWRGALAIALPAAAVATLRQNYMVVVGLMLAALLLPGGGTDWRASRRRFGLVVALLAGLLLPWAAQAFRSNHTFLFPIFPGNYDRDYAGLTAPSSWQARFAIYRIAVFHDEPVRTMPLFLLLAPLLARGAHRRALLGLWVGTVIGFAMVALSLPDADLFSILRYGFAFVTAFALATGLATAERLAAAPSRRDLAVVCVALLAFVLQIDGTRPAASRNLNVAIERASAGDPNPSLRAAAASVAAMQEAVPRGERLLVMIERPYLLDYRRNQILHLDQPGAASPPPRIPLAAGGDAVAQYLLNQQLRYVAFARSDRAEIDLYRRAHWQRLLTGNMRIWRNAAPIYLSAFNALDQIAATHRKLHDDGHLVVVDLTRPAP